MAEEPGGTQDAVDEARQMREHEREAREREPTEGRPEERQTGEPGGAPVFPGQKNMGS